MTRHRGATHPLRFTRKTPAGCWRYTLGVRRLAAAAVVSRLAGTRGRGKPRPETGGAKAPHSIRFVRGLRAEHEGQHADERKNRGAAKLQGPNPNGATEWIGRKRSSQCFRSLRRGKCSPSNADHKNREACPCGRQASQRENRILDRRSHSLSVTGHRSYVSTL